MRGRAREGGAFASCAAELPRRVRSRACARALVWSSAIVGWISVGFVFRFGTSIGAMGRRCPYQLTGGRVL
jgi:hypothetical protein